jgi:hypothetical protein
VTRDYYRHGTTTLFAALSVLDGSVIALCTSRHPHQEFLDFLNHLDRQVPADLELHLIADNYATCKQPKVKAWLARHPRFRIHNTPTYASWLNGGALVRAHHPTGDPARLVPQRAPPGPQNQQLPDSLQRSQAPFIFADPILGKLQRLFKVISGTQH